MHAIEEQVVFTFAEATRTAALIDKAATEAEAAQAQVEAITAEIAEHEAAYSIEDLRQGYMDARAKLLENDDLTYAKDVLKEKRKQARKDGRDLYKARAAARAKLKAAKVIAGEATARLMSGLRKAGA